MTGGTGVIPELLVQGGLAGGIMGVQGYNTSLANSIKEYASKPHNFSPGYPNGVYYDLSKPDDVYQIMSDPEFVAQRNKQAAQTAAIDATTGALMSVIPGAATGATKLGLTGGLISAVDKGGVEAFKSVMEAGGKSMGTKLAVAGGTAGVGTVLGLGTAQTAANNVAAGRPWNEGLSEGASMLLAQDLLMKGGHALFTPKPAAAPAAPKLEPGFDSNGNVHYAETPPPAAAEQAVPPVEQPSVTPAAAPVAETAPAPVPPAAEPAPAPVASEQANRVPVYPGEEAPLDQRLAWFAQYGKTHFTSGNPRPPAYIEGTPEYAAREARDAAKNQPAPTAAQPEAIPTPQAKPAAEANPAPAAEQPVAEATPEPTPVSQEVPAPVEPIAAETQPAQELPRSVQMLDAEAAANAKPRVVVPALPRAKEAVQPVVEPTPAPAPAAEAKPATPDVDPVTGKKLPQGVVEARKTADALIAAGLGDTAAAKNAVAQVNRWEDQNGRPKSYQTQQGELGQQPVVQPTERPIPAAEPIKRSKAIQDAVDQVGKLEKSLAGATEKDRLRIERQLKLRRDQVNADDVRNGRKPTYGEAEQPALPVQPETPATAEAKPANLSPKETKPVAQTEIPGTAETFNLAGENVAASEEPTTRPDSLTGELPGAAAEAKPVEPIAAPEANGTTWNGQNVQFTGNTKKQKGGTFYEFQFKDGEKKGQMGYTNSDEFKAAHEDAVKNPPPPIEVGAEVKPKEKKVLSKGNPDEPASVQQARRVINGEMERSGGKRYDKALDLVEQYEADQKLSKYEMPENLDKASDQAIEDFLKKHEERVAYEEGEGIEGNKAENDFAEKVREYFDNRMNASTMMGDVIKDLRGLMKRHGIKLPTIPTWFPDKHGQAFADAVKGIAPDLFAPPPMLSRMVSAETLKDPHWRAKATAQVEGMIERASTSLSEMGWDQVNPFVHNSYDALLDLLTKHAAGEATYPAGGVGGADRTNPRKYTPVEKKVSFLDSAEEWADAKLKEGRGRTNIAVDPEMAVALAIKGIANAGRAAGDFAVWSKAMVDEFGNAVKPHLEAAWEKLKDLPALQAEAAAHALIRDDAGKSPLDLHASLMEEAAKYENEKNQKDAERKANEPETSGFQKSINTPIVAWFRSVGGRLQSLRDINTQSPTMKKAVEMFVGDPGRTGSRDFVTANSNQKAEFANRVAVSLEPIAELIHSMTPEAQANLEKQMVKAIESGAEVKGHLGAAIKEIKAVLADQHVYSNEAGVKIGEVRNYFDRVMNNDKVTADPAGFVAGAEKAYEDKWRREQAAEAAKLGLPMSEPTSKDKLSFRNQAIAWKDAIVLNHEGWNFEKKIFEEHKPSNKENFQKERQFTAAEAKHFEDFRNYNLFEIIGSHIHRTVKQAELTRRLGADGEKYLEMKAKMREESVPESHIRAFENYIKNIIGYDKVAAIELASKGDSQVAAKRGEQAEFYSNLSHLVTTTSLLAKTPGLIYTEPVGITHHANMAVSTGGVLLHNLLNIAKMGLRDGENPINRANGSFNLGHDIDSALALFKGITHAHSPLLEGHAGYLPEEMTEGVKTRTPLFENKLVRKVTGNAPNRSVAMKTLLSKVMNGMLLTPLERSKRETSVWAGRQFLDKMAGDVTGEDHPSNFSAITPEQRKAYASERLKGIGISEADLPKFTKFVKDLRGMSDVEKYEAITDRTNPMARKYANAFEMFSKQSVVQVTTASRTMLANQSAFGKAVHALETYPNEYLLQHSRFLYEEAKRATKSGIPVGERLAYGKALAAIPVTMAVMLGYREMLKAFRTATGAKDHEESWMAKLISAATSPGYAGSGIDSVVRLFERGEFNFMGTAALPIKNAAKAVKAESDKPGSNQAAGVVGRTAFSTVAKPGLTTALALATNAAPGIAKIAPFLALQALATPAAENAAGDAAKEMAGEDESQKPVKFVKPASANRRPSAPPKK